VITYEYPEDIDLIDAETCSEDSDCSSFPSYICSDTVCIHKGIFPILEKEFLGMVTLPLLLGLATVGGGGGLFVPMVMTFWVFDTKAAIALSGSVSFLGALVRYIYQFREKHPEKEARTIDYGIVIVMMPMVVMGSFTGVLINIMLPSVTIIILLTLVLICLTIHSAIQAYSLHSKEDLKRSIDAKLEQRGFKFPRKLEYVPFDRSFCNSPRGSVHEERENRSAALEFKRSKTPLPGKCSPLPLEIEEVNVNYAPNSSKGELRCNDLCSEEDVRSLHTLLEAENSHLKQWSKQLMCFLCIGLSTVVTFLRGSHKTPSIMKI
jgi:hypothetical protein